MSREEKSINENHQKIKKSVAHYRPGSSLVRSNMEPSDSESDAVGCLFVDVDVGCGRCQW